MPYTYKNGVWIGADGQPLDEAGQQRQNARWASLHSNVGVRTPGEAGTALAQAPEGMGRVIGQSAMDLIRNPRRNVPPLLLQGGGEEVGALAGAPLGPMGAMAGGAIGAGLGGLASKYLPQRYGGSPEESKLSAFGRPALLGAAGRTPGVIKGALEKRIASNLQARVEEFDKLSESAAKITHQRIGETLIPKVPKDKVLEVQNVSGLKPYSQEPTSPTGQQEAFETRDAIMGPISRMRKKFGDPIGQVYNSIKSDATLSGLEAQDLSDAVSGLSPQSLRGMPITAGLVKEMNASGLPPQFRGQFAAQNPPTVQAVIHARQEVAHALGQATGEDVHNLGDLRQALDQSLLGYLPSSMKALNSNYYQFIQNYPWKEIRDLRHIGTAPEMAQWMFDKKAPQVVEMLNKATPEERAMYRRLYSARLFEDVDPSEPPIKQVVQMQKNAAKDKDAIGALYGSTKAKEIQDIIQYPERQVFAHRVWQRPDVQRKWTEAFMKASSKRGAADQMAADRGFQALLNDLSPEDKQAFMDALPTGQPTGVDSPEPVLKGGAVQTLTDAWKQRASKKSTITHRLSWAIPWGIGSILMTGHPSGYAAGMIATATAVGASGAGYRWMVNHGLAEYGSRAALALTRGNYLDSANQVLTALALAGGRMRHERVRAPVDPRSTLDTRIVSD